MSGAKFDQGIWLQQCWSSGRATYPNQAKILRRIMKHAYILVPVMVPKEEQQRM